MLPSRLRRWIDRVRGRERYPGEHRAGETEGSVQFTMIWRTEGNVNGDERGVAVLDMVEVVRGMEAKGECDTLEKSAERGCTSPTTDRGVGLETIERTNK